ncbi:MAG: cell division protein FtsZ [Prosthecobacter sp.]
MVEYDRNSLNEQATPSTLKTCIVGVGGAGGNVLDRITLDRSVEATLVAMHTDIRVLSHSMAPVKIQLGIELMRGVGAGGDPELGREAALYSREQIRQAIDGHDIIFICTGLGGGTGSGAAPVIAEIAKGTGALVFLTATMPFSFEGQRRLKQAEESLEQLQKRTDALILFENNRMGELILPKDGIQKAFIQADQLIAQSLRAVSTIVTMPGLVKLGLDDLTSALSTSNGRCLFGFGEARGQNRGSEALKRALKSPLIDQGRLLHQTKTLLVHIAGGESLTLLEVDAIMKQLGKNVPDQTHILFGVAVDIKLGESVSVTLISSLGLNQLNTVAAAAPPSAMLPLKERAMPSVLNAVAAKPAAPAKPTPAPVEQALDLLFNTDEITTAAPVEEPAVEEEQVEIFESEAVIDEVILDEPEAELPVIEEEIEIQMEEEFQEEPEAYVPEPEPEPAKPAARPRIEDFIPVIPRTNTSLASVVSRTATPLDESAYAPATPINVVSPVKKPSAQDEQIAFRFGSDQDRGRFKDTEPALAGGGEDLDVPTWMRLKRKLKR